MRNLHIASANMNARLLTVLMALTPAISCQNKSEKPLVDVTDKKLGDLNESEKINLFSQVAEDFRGDYRKYVGQREDSTKFQLALNQDGRFAISFVPFLNDDVHPKDSTITFTFSNRPGFRNIGVGRWSDAGENIKLRFLLGQSAFFDSLKNDGVIQVVDDQTVMLSKDAKRVWISEALCEMD